MSVSLPIHSVLPDLLAALRDGRSAVLIAPPGAGKTTAVAPALLDQPWCSGQILVTSPRRVAARAAAERMAELLGEQAGETVGYLTRLDSRQSARTRILVLSEAILVNRLCDDPELAGVSALLFDEAHERHLDCDLGLALALETQAVLRPDLRLLIMSATMDGEKFIDLLGHDAKVVASEGRAYPLAIRWLGSSPAQRIEDAATQAVMTAWREQTGDMLVFLPGVREINRVQEHLHARLPGTPVLPLHSQVEPAEQRRALRRDADGRRRIVLATSIAETSLTLDGVSVVVDGGLARRAQFDRTAGTTHLTTVRASQAAATQRAGRAARQGPGVTYRLWEEAGHGGRPPYDPPEILTADLSPLLLSLANWGSADASALRWLDPPPASALAAAGEKLEQLGALDEKRRLTEHSRLMGALPLDPEGAAMVLFGARHGAARPAARLALLLQERTLGGRDLDLGQRLARLETDSSPRANAARRLADGWARRAQELAGTASDRMTCPSVGVLLAAARPAFICQRRDNSGEYWLSAGGRGFLLDPADPLARSSYLVVGDAQGQAKGARITSAAPLTLAELEEWYPHRIQTRSSVQWDGQRIVCSRQRRLGAMVLQSGPDPAPDEDALTDLLAQKALEQLDDLLPSDLLARADFAGIGVLGREQLKATAASWLNPLLSGSRDLHLPKAKVAAALLDLLTWDDRQRLDRLAPAEFSTPAGTRHPIDFTGADAPSVEVRVQALFGLDAHPLVGTAPLLLRLTSPAGRPIQATRDLPRFWRGSWADVRREMKGRYPKHRWPEEPWREQASLKTKNAFAAGKS